MAGQIIKRHEKCYLVRWFIGRDKDGKRIYKSETVKGTKKEAQARLAEIQHSRVNGTYVNPNRLTVDDFLDKYLAEAVVHRASPKTISTYRSLLDTHVRPVLGARKLSSLTPMDIQSLLNRLTRSRSAGKKKAEPKPLSSRTRRAVYQTLSTALRQAVRWRLIARNPCDDLDPPRRTAGAGLGREVRALSQEELKRFRGVAQGTEHELLWDFLVVAGCRPGEALAVRWEDLDDEAVTIRRALTQDEKGRPRFDCPKTGRVRRIPLPTDLLERIRGHRSRQAEHALRMGGMYDRSEGLVFANLIGRPLELSNLRRRHLKPLMEKAEVPGVSGPYVFRHTAATLMLAAGIPVKVVSERLGHASAAMTLDVYAHVVEGLQEKATAVLGGLVR